MTLLRARELGVCTGILPPGAMNAITDVQDVKVGHVTLIDGDAIRTGVTAILPHSGNLHAERVACGVSVGNGYGKLAGSTQVQELGELESPILLTNTLSVGAAVEGVVRWTLAQPGNEQVHSVNAVVGETNDSVVNDIRSLAVRPEHAIRAIQSAAEGVVAEGSVGAGTGTQAFGWKGGIGTSSRCIRTAGGIFTVGVLLVTNFGGTLTIAGASVGEALGENYLPDELALARADGSVVVVVATDAPLSDRNLARMARRTFLGLGRTGFCMPNASGDYALAFSTALAARRARGESGITVGTQLANDAMSPLFLAALESTEEAVYNALFSAASVSSHCGALNALPREQVLEILARRGVLRGN